MRTRIDPTPYVCAGCGAWLTREDDLRGRCSCCGTFLADDLNMMESEIADV